MKTKEKLDKALELITQLRVMIINGGFTSQALEFKSYKIETAICEGIDLLNNVDLANVRLSLPRPMEAYDTAHRIGKPEFKEWFLEREKGYEA